MDALSPQRIHEIGERLAAREAELVALLHVASRAAASDASEHEVRDFKDLAAQESQSAVQILAVWQAAQELSEVAAARRRIAHGSYGVCQSCGEPIAPSRLDAVPAASLCTECQSRHERWDPLPAH